MAVVEKEVQLDWYVPDELVSHHANNIVVQYLDGEYIISFFETLPPIVLGTPEERRRQAEQINSVRARCVARIIVPGTKMESFIGALAQSYTRVIMENEPQQGPETTEVE
jgi:hypothetical protein